MSQDLLLYTQDLEQAKKEIVALGGRVTQQFTESVFVVSLPDAVNLQTLQYSTTAPPSSLDSVSQLAANAWNKLQEKALDDAAPRGTEGLSWDTPGYLPPQYHENESDTTPRSATSTEKRPEESTGTPTSRYMVGSIAVGIVIVSGTRSDLAFSTAEQQQVIQEVQEGLNFLASAEPRANITFVYDIRLVTVSVNPGSTDDYESAESPWRDAALQNMGFSASRAGSVQYVQNLQKSNKTDWAYVGYFTKYPLRHFAYAIDEKVCMNYSNDGWGSDQINRVFAHESCHIFGAADEYGDCSCGGSYGQLGFPNNNCVKCPGGHVSCLMDANVLDLCQWSRGQIGWDERLFPNRWESLGGVLSSAPDVCSWAAGRLDIFVRGTDDALWHKWFDGGWSDWESLGGILTSDPTAVSWGNGRIDVFARGTDNALWHKWFDGGWSDWESLGGVLSSGPDVCSWAAGRLDIFVRGTDNALWHKWFDGGWSDWESLGGILTSDPTAVSWSNGRIDVFARGADNALWHKWFDGGWSDWESLGGVLSSGPDVCSWAAGRLDIFVRGTDNALWHKWFDGGWSDWESLGGILTSDPTAVSWANGRIDVFARGADNALWHKWFDGMWRP